MQVGAISPRTRRRLFFLLLLALSCVGTTLFVVLRVKAAPQESIAFSHQAMVQAGVTCLYCHADARRSPAAGMPSVEKCMGCHRTIATDNPEVQKLAGYWNRQEAIPWPRLNRLPRFVYFTHRVHIAQGLNCERCHGDVGHMELAQPVVLMNMGWCLSCHNSQPNAGQLRSCVVCHQ